MAHQRLRLSWLQRWWEQEVSPGRATERYDDQPEEVRITEYYEHLLVRKELLTHELASRRDGPRAHLRDSIRQINRALGLGPQSTDDPLIDHWERQIAEGERPDLDMTLDDLAALPGYEWVSKWLIK